MVWKRRKKEEGGSSLKPSARGEEKKKDGRNVMVTLKGFEKAAFSPRGERREKKKGREEKRKAKPRGVLDALPLLPPHVQPLRLLQLLPFLQPDEHDIPVCEGCTDVCLRKGRNRRERNPEPDRGWKSRFSAALLAS